MTSTTTLRSSTAPYILSKENTPQAARAEREAWRETRTQLSALLNILLSIFAVATAVWWGAGSHSIIWVRSATLTQKTAVGLGAALLVGTAEVVLYARYWRATETRRRKRVAKTARP